LLVGAYLEIPVVSPTHTLFNSPWGAKSAADDEAAFHLWRSSLGASPCISEAYPYFTIEIRTRACSFRLCAGPTGRRRAGGGAKNQEPRCEGGASRNGTAPCACRIWTKPERSCDAKEELPGAARLWRARAGRDLSGASNDACNYDELLIDSAP